MPVPRAVFIPLLPITVGFVAHYAGLTPGRPPWTVRRMHRIFDFQDEKELRALAGLPPMKHEDCPELQASVVLKREWERFRGREQQ